MPTIELPTHRLFFTDDGDGDPPLLLVHGLGGDSSDWIHQIPGWRSGHRLIVPDLRGHGASTDPGAGFHPDDYETDLLALLDALEVPRVVVVGHSLGAVVAARMAVRHPQRVHAAVLLDPTYGDPAESGARVAALIEGLAQHSDPAELAAAFGAREGAAASPVLREWHRRRLLATPAHVITETLVELHARRLPILTGDIDPQIRERGVPTLVLHALPGKAAWERGLIDEPRSVVQDWSARSGHWMHHEQPEQVTALVLDWLDTL